MAPCLVLASRKLWSRERWDVVAAGEVVVVDLIWWSNGWRVGEESWLMLGAVDVCALTTRAEKRSYEYNRAVPRVLVATPGKAKHNDRSDAWRRDR